MLFGEGEERRDHVLIDDVADACVRDPDAAGAGRPQRRDRRSAFVPRDRRADRRTAAPIGSPSRRRSAAARCRITAIAPFDAAATRAAFPDFRVHAARPMASSACRQLRRGRSSGSRDRSAPRAAPDQAQHRRSARRPRDPSVIAIAQPVRRDVLRRAARLRLRRLPLRRPLDAGGARHRRAFRPQARHARARRRLRQGLPGQGPDGGLPGARGVRPRHLALRADALRARGGRPAAPGHGGDAAVSRQELRLRALPQHRAQFPAHARRSR